MAALCRQRAVTDQIASTLRNSPVRIELAAPQHTQDNALGRRRGRPAESAARTSLMRNDLPPQTKEYFVEAYVIAMYDIVDPNAFETYVPGVIPLFHKHGAEVLVADFDAQALEGDKRSAYVVLKFKSEASALAWYTDPDYQPFKKIRVASCDNRSVALARQFVPPTT